MYKNSWEKLPIYRCRISKPPTSIKGKSWKIPQNYVIFASMVETCLKFVTIVCYPHKISITKLVGGFNHPSERYAQVKLESFGVNMKKYLKPPPR